MCIIRTKDELERAVDQGVQEIIIEGELAKKVRTGRKLKLYGAATIAAIGAAIAATPFTAGLSLAIGAPAIAVLTGTEIALIIVCITLGIGLLLAIWKGYEEVIWEPGPPPKLILRRKQNP